MAEGLLFPPLDPQSARLKLEQLLRHKPTDLGMQQSRWTLGSLLSASSFLGLRSLSGLHQVLTRLGISLQRARSWLRSPDPEYEAKLAFIKQCIAQGHNRDTVAVFVDEFTYSIHASVSRDYALKCQQPKAHRAIGYEKTWRIIAAMNGFTGQLTYWQRAQIKVPTFVQFLKQVAEAYPQASTIFVILDNWPVHFHPDVIQALEPQTNPFASHLPKHWIKPSGKYAQWNLPIQLVPLPTYASWLNPIEKLWKWIKKDLIHHHNLAHDFEQLKELVEAWLKGFEKPSQKLLSFCGLLKANGIFADALSKK